MFVSWIGLPPSFEAYSTDAALGGYAVTRSVLPKERCREILKTQERWRFKHEHIRSIPARARVLANRDELNDIFSVKPLVNGEIAPNIVMDPLFLEVPSDVLLPSNWALLWHAPFNDSEDIHV